MDCEEPATRKKVSLACSNCRRLHKRCDEQRPCSYCNKAGVADSCEDWKPKSTARRGSRDAQGLEHKELLPDSAVPSRSQDQAPAPSSLFPTPLMPQISIGDFVGSLSTEEISRPSFLPFNPSLLRHMRAIHQASMSARRNSAPELFGPRWSDFEFPFGAMSPGLSLGGLSSSFFGSRRDSMSSSGFSHANDQDWVAPLTPTEPTVPAHSIIFVKEEPLPQAPSQTPVLPEPPDNLFQTDPSLNLNPDSFLQFSDDDDEGAENSQETKQANKKQRLDSQSNFAPSFGDSQSQSQDSPALSPPHAEITPQPSSQPLQTFEEFKLQNEVWGHVFDLDKEASAILVFDMKAHKPLFASRGFLELTGLTTEQIHTSTSFVQPFLDEANSVNIKDLIMDSNFHLTTEAAVNIPNPGMRASELSGAASDMSFAELFAPICIRTSMTAFVDNSSTPRYWVFSCL